MSAAGWRALAFAIIGIQSAPAADIGANALQNKTIGYVATDFHWAIYQTPSAKSECPNGLNEGPREQFSRLYPNHGKKHTLSETQLHLETETWFPSGAEDALPFHAATGRISYGLNLDGKVGANDFTSPDGEPGIDNQLFRVLGCVIGYRAPDGVEYIFGPKAIVDSAYNRTMIELTGVDSLINDEDVAVTVYRGLDRLLTDASGNKIMPGGSQRADMRWGRPFIQHYHGKIVDGVLTTEPGEFIFPWMTLRVPTYERLHDMRMRLRLTASTAEGLIAGYADVETWYTQLIRNDSTHHLSNGQMSALSLHKALHQFADAYPDPKTGANTAISSALDVKFTQVFIQHPEVPQAAAALRR
jgi:hypothetical protein